VEARTVLITGIGGNVAQGIIRNIGTSGYPIRIVGTDTGEMSSGNHLVDAFYRIPYGYERDYIPAMIRIAQAEQVDLIIPSTDYEVYALALHREAFPCRIACSGVESSRLYLDKYLSWQFHHHEGIAFAESCLPTHYRGEYDKAIAKPRKGRGARGIIRGITDANGLSDDEYLIQREYEGTEITTAVYCCYSNRFLHGMITMERTLENGTTVYCRVTRDYDSTLKKIVTRMIEKTDLVGSFNIQSIVTRTGEVIPFEINCRISGTNSIRSAFGFHDVRYTVDELLWNIQPDPVEVTDGIAYRMLIDVIYPEVSTDRDLKKNKKDIFLLF
jgi:carbamoyl-phosphate synthase large subunit